MSPLLLTARLKKQLQLIQGVLRRHPNELENTWNLKREVKTTKKHRIEVSMKKISNSLSVSLVNNNPIKTQIFKLDHEGFLRGNSEKIDKLIKQNV